ncbi:MAG TPA: amidohydrolase, partial [Firmicutes bacterium]|nr:amidohydrolase [Bacillota bacterium]
CEYDALPDIGHGCGHNMIGVMGAGAGVGLSTVLTRAGGKITVLGTPAEETSGAKVAMTEQGIFTGIDVAMMLHPDGVSYASGSSLAMEAVQFAFRGKASHAAAAPEKGINALQGVIQTFNGIGALREHLASDVRIHGIITQGGAAPNIVPDYAAARFYVRAGRRRELAEVMEKVKNCARGAALMTGATLEISAYEHAYADMNTNKALA